MKLGSVFAFAVGSLFGVTAIAGFGFWLLAVRAPSAELQCDHLIELVRKETGNDADAQFREACIAKVEKTDAESVVRYADRSKCVIAARSLERAAKCDGDAAN